MGEPAQHHAINYVEFVTSDLERAKAFYGKVFGWSFQDWGPEYASFDRESAGIDGGFRVAGSSEEAGPGGPLVILYSRDLEATEHVIKSAGGQIVVPTFEFPGGRRFHFADGCGNVLAVWSE